MVEPSHSSASPFLQTGLVSSLPTPTAPSLDPRAPSRAPSSAHAALFRGLVLAVEDAPPIPFDAP